MLLWLYIKRSTLKMRDGPKNGCVHDRNENIHISPYKQCPTLSPFKIILSMPRTLKCKRTHTKNYSYSPALHLLQKEPNWKDTLLHTVPLLNQSRKHLCFPTQIPGNTTCQTVYCWAGKQHKTSRNKKQNEKPAVSTFAQNIQLCERFSACGSTRMCKLEKCI